MEKYSKKFLADAEPLMQMILEIFDINLSSGNIYIPLEVFYGNLLYIIGKKNKHYNMEDVDNDSEIYVPSMDEMMALITQLEANGKNIALNVFDNEKFVISPKHMAMEKGIARMLNDISSSEKELQLDVDEARVHALGSEIGIRLSESQIKAVLSGLKKDLVVINGDPGTGKTTIIKVIATILAEEGIDFAICAHTGRAAKRVEEATGFAASTIHRLLEAKPFKNSQGEAGGFFFLRNEEMPLDVKYIIVDEFSLVSISLMHSLLRALRSDCRIILVGDYNQLPSIDAGKVLKDIVDSDFATVVTLTDNFRMMAGSSIVSLANRVRKGELEDIFSIAKDDYRFIEESDPQIIMDTISELVTLHDFQVICPTNKGMLGISNVNRCIAESLADGRFKDLSFNLGDKMMQIRNNYERIRFDKDKVPVSEGVYNGEIGRIVGISYEQLTFDDDNDLKIGKFICTPDVAEYKSTILSMKGDYIVSYDGELVEYKFKDNETILAYAITIHKSQGGEFPKVVIPMLNIQGGFYNRKLIYTGITRAKEELILIGDPQCLLYMIRNDRRDADRRSRLKNYLEAFYS